MWTWRPARSRECSKNLRSGVIVWPRTIPVHSNPTAPTARISRRQGPIRRAAAACPAHTDVQAYVGLIAQGKYTEAFEVITSVNPIASVCSMICHHPCEQSCRRCGIDEPLAVRHLKRFAIEQSKDYRRAKRRLSRQDQRQERRHHRLRALRPDRRPRPCRHGLQRHDLREAPGPRRHAGRSHPSLPSCPGRS